MSERPTTADLEAAGVYDPAAPLAGAQLALIEYLLDIGATLDDLIAAGPAELPLVATTIRMWGSRERFTLAEAAASTGTDPALLRRFWRSAGFSEGEADARTLNPRDIENFAVLQAGIDLLGEDVTMQLVRVIGAAAARVAEAAVSVFMVNIGPDALEADPTGLALARANEVSVSMLDGLTAAFDVMLRHNIERGFRPLDALGSRSGVDLVARSIGFADLVESTAWTQELELRDLARALETFDATASGIVVGHGGRVVKLIGDEVMFVANEPASAVEIGLSLVDAFAEHTVLPPVRVGIATGGVVARDGDYSGSVVNLAARAAKLARPSTALVDATTRDAVSSAFAVHGIGARRLKGFDGPVGLFRVTPAD